MFDIQHEYYDVYKLGERRKYCFRPDHDGDFDYLSDDGGSELYVVNFACSTNNITECTFSTQDRCPTYRSTYVYCYGSKSERQVQKNAKNNNFKLKSSFLCVSFFLNNYLRLHSFSDQVKNSLITLDCIFTLF